MELSEVLSWIKENKDEKAIKGMARFAIGGKNNYGISIYKLRPYAKQIGTNHHLALELWETGIHDARLLATMIDNYAEVTEEQMEKWVIDFDSWDICDQCCSNLFGDTPYAVNKVFEWCRREEEFVKRAGYVIIAVLSVHNKQMTDKDFINFFPIVKEGSIDERNFVKKAVNWSIRQVGKRNLVLNKEAIKLSEEIRLIESKSAKWIASDAIRELTSEKIHKWIKK